MNLLKELRAQLAALGKLEIAWFTSFNSNIEFIETYLLPAVLDADPPRNRLDYEHFQLTLTRLGIDFRVFCDKRFIRPEQNKRTAIPVHGISPALFEDFTADSLFHPKVIYLEGENGRLLGVGSANLTIGGWGRNQEVFRFFKVETLENYRAIREFFATLFVSVGLESPLRKRSFDKEKEKDGWRFVHSFQRQSFLEQLFEEGDRAELVVWSPFLAEDLPGFVNGIREEQELDELMVRIVPDRIEGSRIRTPLTPELKKCVKQGGVAFHMSPFPQDHRADMCHAKLWKLGNRLAIGSWNFTAQGANLGLADPDRKHEVNIEAGVIFRERTPAEDFVGTLIPIADQNFATEAQLAEEQLQVPEAPPFDVQVRFDWKQQCYEFTGTWNKAEKADIDQGYALKVPGYQPLVCLSWRPRALDLVVDPVFLGDPAALLQERRYEVWRRGKIVWRGLIEEVELGCRRPQAFESLGELLDAFVFGDGPGPDDPIPFRLPMRENSESLDGELADELAAPSAEEGRPISYFRLFQATANYAARLGAAKSVPELNMLVFTGPGCLLELLEKARVQISEDGSPVFAWFLAQEVRSLFKKAQEVRAALGDNDASMPKARWDALELPVPRLRNVSSNYLGLIRKECSYGRA
jgi:hypothetical protein